MKSTSYYKIALELPNLLSIENQFQLFDVDFSIRKDNVDGFQIPIFPMEGNLLYEMFGSIIALKNDLKFNSR